MMELESVKPKRTRKNKKEQHETTEMKLTISEQQVIERDLADIKYYELEQKYLMEQEKNAKLKRELHDRDYRLLSYALQESSKRVQEINEKLKSKKEQHREALRNIAKRLNIKEGFGFNPETGEVIPN